MPSAGPMPRRGLQHFALAVLLASFAVLVIGVKVPHVTLVIAAAAAGLTVDLALRQWLPAVPAALARVHCAETVRQLLRDLLVLAMLVQLPGLETSDRLLLATGLLAGYALHFVTRGLSIVVRRSRTLPVLTRNIDTSGLRLSPAPPRLLARQSGHRLLLFSVPATAGLLATVATEQVIWGLLGTGTTVLLALAGAVHLATWLLPGKRPPSERQVLAWLDAWLDGYRPDVALYFSGGNATAYQANMWLTTLAALDGKPLIVLRERCMVQLIAATDVPMVCIPKVAHLMHLEHSTLKMMLHPANAPKTTQVLRIPSIKHAFTNHGESDKLSSCNPYAKVYDEVWVAGPAARERYALADVGVDDRDVVEVGRPQLAPVRPADGRPPADGPVTVLYAPTWEGWTKDPGNTSVILAGENIVSALLADERVRLLYKPHPMTGSVDARAGAADARIRALIAEANAARAPRHDPAAREELARRTAELDSLTATAFRADADDLERMMLQGAPEPGRAARVEAATAAWETAFWASHAPGEHLVLDGPRPAIYACFNQADLLVTDVSSVVSDFLASSKPYAVVNTSGMTDAEFRAVNPTVRAATVLGRDADGIPALLATVRDPALDTLAADRAALKEHLLGPSDPPSLERFRAATAALCDKSDARRRRQAGDGPKIPAQRTAGAGAAAATPGTPS
ncbi:hypothetical protein GCM10009716_37160 [Streptomyces sodiiphilus]|uniref:Integral membrane protein n=1 Tax=Streptomyces sodiiphilus TaxID=226217 RepID=A0ABN2PNW5_9ACTN